VQFGAYVAVPYFAPYMLGHLHFSYAEYMVVVSSVVVTKVLALPALGRVAQRHGAWRLLVIGGLGVIPMAALWTLSSNVAFLLVINFVSGFVWGAFELGFLLLFFEAIDARQRVAMLTLYNVGYASATVAGSICGALVLATLGAGSVGYAAVFLLSSLARLCAAPLLLRVRLPNPAAEALADMPHFVEEIVEELAAPQAA
jgi:MFS family permease